MKLKFLPLLVLFVSSCLGARNILLIGRTGSGKSSLGNVIINKNGNFEEVFKEGKYATSETKYSQVEEAVINGIEYRIIDTVGIGDTKLDIKEVLYRIVGIDRSILREGFSQIIFVTSGKLTREETEVYNILKKVLFDEEVIKYITIVRNVKGHFPNFRIPKECEEDKQKIIEESGELAEIIKSCNEFIHVSIPSLKDKRRAGLNREDREDSRIKLLTHLHTYQSVYKPDNLDKIISLIDKFVCRLMGDCQGPSEDEKNTAFIQFVVEHIKEIVAFISPLLFFLI